VKQADLVEAVWRLSRRPDPWAWPDWSFAGPDGTFGNRFDDPLAVYRVLYASSQRFASFVECLAVLRPDPEVLAELDVIEADARDSDEPPGAGVVPSEWVEQRSVGHGRPEGDLRATSSSWATKGLRPTWWMSVTPCQSHTLLSEVALTLLLER
jgi:hypothetical protein